MILLIWTALEQEPLPRGPGIYYLVGLYYIYSIFWSILKSREEKIFKLIYQFYTFYPKSMSLGVNGQEIYFKIVCLFLPTSATYKVW